MMSAIVHTTALWAEMIKLSHAVFALPFAVVATFLAGRHLPGGRPAWGQLALIVACMVAARSVAMTFNRIADADIDARNPRTAGRPLPRGLITPGAAWTFLAIAGLLFLLACWSFLALYGNPWPIALAGPVLVYLCAYSYCKRFTRWSHFYLGSAIALSPAAAWLAVDPPSLGLDAALLVGAVTCWIAGFDIIYACQDIDCDRRDGLHSLPAGLGPRTALWIARGAHAVTVVLLVVLGINAGLGWLYALGVAMVALLLVVENALVSPHDFSRINLAFFTVNGVVSILLGIVAVTDVLLDLRPPFALWGDL